MLKLVCLTLFCVTLALGSPNQLIKHNNTTGRIIGGSSANAGEFPYSAALYIQTSDETFFCGGTLLSTRWILTAASCVSLAHSVTIILGSNTLQGTDPNRQTFASATHVVHPNYNPQTLINNIGLIELRMPLSYNDYIRFIYLPTAELNDYEITTALGWGQVNDQDAGLANHLNSVTVTSLPDAECNRVFSGIQENMFCVEGNLNEGTCIGDIGGPLVYLLNDRHPTIVGVASFISQNGCEATDPSGFTRIYPYRDWIREVTGIL